MLKVAGTTPIRNTMVTIIQELPMSELPKQEFEDAPLNPALKSRTDTAYDTETSTPPPLETTGAKEGQGEGWPIVWLVVTILCVAVTIYLVL